MRCTKRDDSVAAVGALEAPSCLMLRRLLPLPFDVKHVESMSEKRRLRRVEDDHRAVMGVLAAVDAADRPNLQFEIDVLADEVNFRANWFAIAAHLRHVHDLSSSRGLEVGSSVGTKLLIMQRLGASDLVGCDFAAHLIDDGQHWVEAAGVDGIELHVSGERSLPFAAAEFDWLTLQMVYCQLGDDAIDPLLAEMHRVLRPGGLALVHDGANPHHQPTADAMRAYYREVELGSGGDAAPDGPLYVMRRAVIAREAAQLDPETIDHLARTTAYMREDAVCAAVEAFVESGTEPASPFRDDAADLVPPVMLDGQAVRRPTDPYDMKLRLERAGFQVEFRDGHLGGPLADVPAYFASSPSVFLIARKA